jgi:SNF2 family DNA or RNA helicase
MKCKFCGAEDVGVKSRAWKNIKDVEFEFLHLTCGHTVPVPGLKNVESYDMKSLDEEVPYKYQLRSSEFARRARMRCIFTHQQGVGKMIISLIILKHHIGEMSPCMVLCKGGITVQWAMKVARWLGIPAQVINSGKDNVMWGITPLIICSYDVLRRVKWLDEARDKVKTFILDEVQNVKNTSAQRTQHVMDIVPGARYVMGLSGTPIKNHGREYYPILHMVRPDKFPTYADYERRWLWGDGSIRDYKAFHEYTKDFIQRFTREEVLPDLPQITRNYEYHVMTEEVEKAYEEALKEFGKFMTLGQGMSGISGYGQGMAYLNKMRHLTGLAKAGPTLEFVKEFLESTERKITIFIHHKDVGTLLRLRLTEHCKKIGINPPVVLHSGLNAEQRNEVCSVEFWKPENRILLASTLVGGEGFNLQCCSDIIMAERQWNPADEEQPESRFPRPGQQADKITATYMVAVGTVDEFFAKLVEKKRQICTEIVDGRKAVKWNETKIMKELAEILATQGMKAWIER